MPSDWVWAFLLIADIYFFLMWVISGEMPNQKSWKGFFESLTYGLRLKAGNSNRHFHGRLTLFMKYAVPAWAFLIGVLTVIYNLTGFRQPSPAFEFL